MNVNMELTFEQNAVWPERFKWNEKETKPNSVRNQIEWQGKRAEDVCTYLYTDKERASDNVAAKKH